jgi:hypothetical protein
MDRGSGPPGSHVACWRLSGGLGRQQLLRFPAQNGPFCTMCFRQFTKNVTKTDHKEESHPHSTKYDTQPTSYLISKQAVPYWTCGGTCYPGVSAPKTQSLVDSSLTNHKLWRSQPSPPFQTLLKSQHWISPRSPHIMTDGRPTLSTLNTSQSQHHKDRKTWWLKTAGQSSATNPKNPILKYESLGN